MSTSTSKARIKPPISTEDADELIYKTSLDDLYNFWRATLPDFEVESAKIDLLVSDLFEFAAKNGVHGTHLAMASIAPPGRNLSSPGLMFGRAAPQPAAAVEQTVVWPGEDLTSTTLRSPHIVRPKPCLENPGNYSGAAHHISRK